MLSVCVCVGLEASERHMWRAVRTQAMHKIVSPRSYMSCLQCQRRTPAHKRVGWYEPPRRGDPFGGLPPVRCKRSLAWRCMQGSSAVHPPSLILRSARGWGRFEVPWARLHRFSKPRCNMSQSYQGTGRREAEFVSRTLQDSALAARCALTYAHSVNRDAARDP